MNRKVVSLLGSLGMGLGIWWLIHSHRSSPLSGQVSAPSAEPKASIAAPSNKGVTASAQIRSNVGAISNKTPGRATPDAFDAFAVWLDRYGSANPADKAALAEEGRKLAQDRAAAMADLIRQDPEQAIQKSLNYAQRKALPGFAQGWVEQPVNALADYEVVGGTPLDGQALSTAYVRRGYRLNGDLYEAYTYGDALQWPSQTGRNINGIVLPASAAPSALSSEPFPTGRSQGIAALSPNPVRVLDTTESQDYLAQLRSEPLCPISGAPVSSQGGLAIGQKGGVYYCYCSLAHLQSDLNAPSTGVDAAGTSSTQPATLLPTWATGTTHAPATWTKGTGKRYIYCRAIFPDYTTYTSDKAVFAAYSGYSNYMVKASYGQYIPAPIGTNPASGSYLTQPLLLPHPVADYESGTADFTADMIAAVHKAGLSLRGYNFFALVNCQRPSFSAAGLGTIGPSMGTDGGSQAWVRLSSSPDSLDPSLLGHEHGHNLYLSHSHGWNTGGQSVIGPGSHDEYGDPDSLMGATWGRDSYVANIRGYLNWLPPASIETITGPGLRHVSLAVLDNNTNGVRNVRIKDPLTSQYYWIEHREGPSWIDAQDATHSIGVRWGSPNGLEAWWLDMSADRLGSTRLWLGHTFDDPVGDVHITPVSIISNSPPTLDVAVAIGPFPSNHPPALTLRASKTNAAINQTIVFTALATDVDGDPLAYGWDYGGSAGDGPDWRNQSQVGHSFAAAGYYNVRCTVSDMKGGEFTETVLIKIGSPTGYDIAGKVVKTDGSPLEGIKISADSGHQAITDADGSYMISGLSPGSYSLQAIDPLTGNSSFELWLANPLQVAPSITNANFTALDSASAFGARIEYFDSTNFGAISLANRTTQFVFPNPGAPSNTVGARWYGLFNAPLAGNYVFHAVGNGMAKLWVGNKLAFDRTQLSSNAEGTAFIQLAEGQPCAVQAEFAATDGQPSFQLLWTPPAGRKAAFTPDRLWPFVGGLRGEYFNSTGLTNLILSRVDPSIAFHWTAPPDAGLPAQNFSVRWTGRVRSLNAGVYSFITTSDDGVRLWVNGRLLVNNWTAHSPADNVGSIGLDANSEYPVTIEYYQGGGDATMDLKWIPPGGVKAVIPTAQLIPGYTGLWAEYYGKTDLSGTPAVAQLDSRVDFHYNNAAPASGVAAVNFSGRWTGIATLPTNGVYNFEVWADDATRLWVNNVKVLDNWGFVGATELSGTINLPFATNAIIRLEMQQDSGDAGVRLMWTPPGGSKTIIPTDALSSRRGGLWTEYFGTGDLSGVAAAASMSSVVSGNYITGGPNSYVTSAPYSIRWSGRLLAGAVGVYHLYLNSAGGARVYLDGKLIINDWTIHTTHDATATASFAAFSSHTLSIEYRNLSGAGSVELDWQPPGAARIMIPSSNLLPPTPAARAAEPTIAASGDGRLQLRWPADSGAQQVLSAPSLGGPSTNWTPSAALPYLSNGLWTVNLGSATNASGFFLLEANQ